jgi:phosphoenolpyruvate---glycerone phosphotransferase subunit DhaK
VKLTSANAIAEEMTAAIVRDLGDRLGASGAGDLLLLVNGFGGTPTIELYLMYNAARQALEKRGMRVARSLVGSFVTSLEMAGCSITVTLLDPETIALWDHPVRTAALRW